tara:strand:- start:82710 stop:83645 length:936 start_codon:yes stop_codon:yes gene_type:complete
VFVNEGETVLDAAIRQGFDFPYSCRSATCATCMGKVLSGSINYGDIEPYALDDDEQKDGLALFCSVHPETDLVIEIEDVYGPEYQPIRSCDYQVDSQQLLADNLHQVILSPVTDKKIRFTAGQYLNVITDENIPVPFSIANAPNDEGKIELHIHDADDFQYTKEIIGKITSKSHLKLRGPYGKMVLQPQPDLPIIFIAGGTGFVPFKAMVEDMIAKGFEREIHIYWRAKSTERLYLKTMCEQWAQQDKITFHGLTDGAVYDAVLNDFSDLANYQVFASGPPEMVYAAKKVLVANGLNPFFIYSDAFECFPE